MELDKVQLIFQNLDKMVNSIYEEDITPKHILAESYNKEELSAGFFCGEDGRWCSKKNARYHAAVVPDVANKLVKIIVNEITPVTPLSKFDNDTIINRKDPNLGDRLTSIPHSLPKARVDKDDIPIEVPLQIGGKHSTPVLEDVSPRRKNVVIDEYQDIR
jgi:hypothetical protein